MHSDISQVFVHMTQSFGLSLLRQPPNFCLGLSSAQHVGSKNSRAQGATLDPESGALLSPFPFILIPNTLFLALLPS